MKVIMVDQAKYLRVFTALSGYKIVTVFVYLGSVIEADEGSLSEMLRLITQTKISYDHTA